MSVAADGARPDKRVATGRVEESGYHARDEARAWRVPAHRVLAGLAALDAPHEEVHTASSISRLGCTENAIALSAFGNCGPLVFLTHATPRAFSVAHVVSTSRGICEIMP